jgi:hypothetical protein
MTEKQSAIKQTRIQILKKVVADFFTSLFGGTPG